MGNGIKKGVANQMKYRFITILHNLKLESEKNRALKFFLVQGFPMGLKYLRKP